MAFVGGLMGPYMRPIPVGASAAMVFSLVVAFIVTPWAAVRLLKPAGTITSTATRTRSPRLYRRVDGPAARRARRMRWLFLVGVVALLLVAAVALVPLGLVTVKMLPFDNKSEFQVMVDMPEGTPLETDRARGGALADAALEDAAVVDVQTLRRARRRPTTSTAWCATTSCAAAPHLADLQVNLVPQGRAADAEPRRSPGACATRCCRSRAQFGAHQGGRGAAGPAGAADAGGGGLRSRSGAAHELARADQDDLRRHAGVVDTDWYVEAPHAK